MRVIFMEREASREGKVKCALQVYQEEASDTQAR